MHSTDKSLLQMAEKEDKKGLLKYGCLSEQEYIAAKSLCDEIDEAATIEVEEEWKRLFRNAFMRGEELVLQSEMWADRFLR